MEDVKRDKCVNKNKEYGTCIKTKGLTYCCAGSGKKGVMENAKRYKCVNKVDGHALKQEYLLTVVVQVVVKKVSWRMQREINV